MADWNNTGSGSPAFEYGCSRRLLAGALALASFVPARRALIVNPVTVLRDDN
jgi:hypothetical protein